jgi:hypothetical protein
MMKAVDGISREAGLSGGGRVPVEIWRKAPKTYILARHFLPARVEN